MSVLVEFPKQHTAEIRKRLQRERREAFLGLLVLAVILGFLAAATIEISWLAAQ